MTDISLDGAWTLILNDQQPGTDKTVEILIEGEKAWNVATPDEIGACVIVEGVLMISLREAGEGPRAYGEVIAVQVSGGPNLSGEVYTVGPDGIEFSDPCILSRDVEVRRRWTNATDFGDEDGNC